MATGYGTNPSDFQSVLVVARIRFGGRRGFVRPQGSIFIVTGIRFGSRRGSVSVAGAGTFLLSMAEVTKTINAQSPLGKNNSAPTSSTLAMSTVNPRAETIFV